LISLKLKGVHFYIQMKNDLPTAPTQKWRLSA